VSTDPDVRHAPPVPPELLRARGARLRVSWLTDTPGPDWLPVWQALARGCDLSVWTPDGDGPHQGRPDVRFRPGGSGRVLPPGRAGELVSADVVVLAGSPLPAAWQVLRAARARGTATVASGPPDGRVGRGRFLRSVDVVLAAGPAAVEAAAALGVAPGSVVATEDPAVVGPAGAPAVADDALDAIRLAALTRQFWVKRPLLY
jgi:hypothetical protein